jgi:hypothetical protein
MRAGGCICWASGGAQIRLFCRAAPGVAVPHQAEPWTPPISKCGRARVEPGAPARVFAAAALAPWPRGVVVPGAGHAIRRPSVCTCLVSHHGQDQRTVVVAA